MPGFRPAAAEIQGARQPVQSSRSRAQRLCIVYRDNHPQVTLRGFHRGELQDAEEGAFEGLVAWGWGGEGWALKPIDQAKLLVALRATVSTLRAPPPLRTNLGF